MGEKCAEHAKNNFFFFLFLSKKRDFIRIRKGKEIAIEKGEREKKRL
jgi:hypothetical protein